MKLGLVTYLWGAQWDLPTLIKNCEETGFGGVELRSTHKHGVEVTLNKTQRQEVRKRFADSKVVCVGLGSACEYHSADHGVVKQNIELTKKFVVLSHEVGASGVKVRPNGFVKGINHEKTIEQIGRSLNECGKFAAEYDQQLRVEVHGRGTQDLRVIKKIIDIADHPNVTVCWNSNPGETINGSIKENFELLKSKLGDVVHIHDLFDERYPYRELFSLLHKNEFKGYCLSESPATTDTLRVMKYYRALWQELIRPQA
jgi:sugar phosphate isomerase/epimerase